MFKKDCTDLVRRISLLTYLFEEIRDSKKAVIDSGNSDASTSSIGSASSWSSDLVLALHSAKRLISVARNFRSNSSSDNSKKLKAHAYIWSNGSDPNLYGDWDFEWMT
ncbi:hypothetical protein K1719_012102 [Acacia pycnantha]|nr:hypothetical protein K1719_026537 [Acacia pycnantha]KAI9117103.1 hypothetical protein K1719_012102 [Acacia pycnantha]